MRNMKKMPNFKAIDNFRMKSIEKNITKPFLKRNLILLSWTIEDSITLKKPVKVMFGTPSKNINCFLNYFTWEFTLVLQRLLNQNGPLIIHMKKPLCLLILGENMPWEDIPRERRDVLLANYVRLLVLLRLLLLRLVRDLIIVEELLDMILIWLNVFIVGIVKRLVQLMLLF